MKKRIIQIEITYDITNISEDELTSIAQAKKAAYLNLQDSQFMEDEGLYDYNVYVIDVEEGDFSD